MDKELDLFISWSGSFGREVAESIKLAIDQITDSSGHGVFSVFVSSVSIELGKKWRSELHSALNKSYRGLIIVTQDIIHTDWISHEAASLTNDNENLWFLLADSPSELLPEPLREYQYTKLSNDSLTAILRSMCQAKNIPLPSSRLLSSLYKDIENVRKRYSYVTSEESRWKNKIEKNLLIKKQEDSPFDLKELIRVAQQRLVLVAQNHRYMTDDENKESNEKFWPLFEAALKGGVDVDIIGMHQDVKPPRLETSNAEIPDALSLWAHYLGAPAFFDHVDSAWKSLEIWSNLFRKLKQSGCAGNLRIYGAYFTPITICAVDPCSESGFLVVSPRPANEANQSRPQFIIYKKSSPDTFDYYWQTLKNSYDNASWKRIFK